MLSQGFCWILGVCFSFVSGYFVNKRVIPSPKWNLWTIFQWGKNQFGQHIVVLRDLNICFVVDYWRFTSFFCKWVSHLQEGHFQSKVESLNHFPMGRNSIGGGGDTKCRIMKKKIWVFLVDLLEPFFAFYLVCTREMEEVTQNTYESWDEHRQIINNFDKLFLSTKSTSSLSIFKAK